MADRGRCEKHRSAPLQQAQPNQGPSARDGSSTLVMNDERHTRVLTPSSARSEAVHLVVSPGSGTPFGASSESPRGGAGTGGVTRSTPPHIFEMRALWGPQCRGDPDLRSNGYGKKTGPRLIGARKKRDATIRQVEPGIPSVRAWRNQNPRFARDGSTVIGIDDVKPRAAWLRARGDTRAESGIWIGS